MKKTKIKPVLIHSREAMLAVVANLVSDKLALAAKQVEIEQAKADIDELARRCQTNEAGLHVWSVQHPEEFDGGKSIDLPSATFGFRTCPPSVEKDKSARTWDDVAARLASTVINDATGQAIFIGENFVRYGSPTVDKTGLIAIRDEIPEAAKKSAGFTIEQEEIFFFKPKSEVLEASSQEAA
jgi:hypothetical protein